jgi:thioredoxin-related protein
VLAAFLFASEAKEEAWEVGAMDSYPAAIAKAKQEKKILVMVIVKEHCRWCHKLVEETLSDDVVQKRLQQFVTLVIDKDDTYPSEFREDFFPAVFFVDYTSGKSMYENIGYTNVKNFLNDLEGAEQIRKSLYADK